MRYLVDYPVVVHTYYDGYNEEDEKEEESQVEVGHHSVPVGHLLLRGGAEKTVNICEGGAL